MKNNILLIFCIVFLSICFSAKTVSAVNRGGFFYLDNWDGIGEGGPEYMTGGTILLDWRDFEPVEGQYQWNLFDDKGTYMRWESIYKNREEHTNIQPNPIPGQIFSNTASGKRLRFKLRVSEGAVPLWLYGGEDSKYGKVSSSYGTMCAYKNQDQVNSGVPDCNPITDIVLDAACTYPPYPEKEACVEPIWWNPIFQEKFRRVVLALGQKIESDPALYSKIEFVEASLGSYGETILYGKQDTGKTDTLVQRLFRGAGYTNKVYSEAVQKNLSFFYEAFKRLPISLSMGNGLYSMRYDDGSGIDSAEGDYFPKVTAKYGSRLYPKFAGFGSECKAYVGTDFKTVCPDKSRCVYESFGGITYWSGWPWNNDYTQLERIFQCSVDHKAYIIMMWTDDFRAINSGHSNLLQAFEATAPKLWALGEIEPHALGSAFYIDLTSGWNTVTWLSTFPADKQSSELPSGCHAATVKKDGFWKERGFIFTGGVRYNLKCGSSTRWLF